MNSRRRRPCRRCDRITRRADRLCADHAPIVSVIAQNGGTVQLNTRARSLVTLTREDAVDLADRLIDAIELATETTNHDK